MARRAGISLGTKLVLGTVLLLAAVVATSVYYNRTLLQSLAQKSGDDRKKDIEDAMRREASLLATNASASASSLLAEGTDYTKLGEMADRLAGAENVVWLQLVNKDGEVMGAGKNAPQKSTAHVDDDLSHKLDKDDPGKIEIVQLDDKTILVGAPAFLGTIRAGEVRLAYDTSYGAKAQAAALALGEQRKDDSLRQQLLFAGVILVVGLLVGIWQGLRISRPLKALSQQARHIASGDFARRVAVHRGDEIGELGESFNIMAESLGQLVDELTRKAGLEREIEVARSIQGLMTPPPDVMTLGSFKLTGRCEMASACGGDWWTYRTLSDGRLLVVVGDVTGHGMPSAMIAATGRGAVEALAMVDHATLTPKLVLQAIDRAIRDVGGRRLLMTSFALIVSSNGAVAFANAGHTFPYVMRRATAPGSGVELSILPVRSNPLGSNNPLIATGEHRLTPGDFMILTSDGLTDRVSESGTRFGDKRLRRTLVDQIGKPSSDIASLCDRIVEEVNGFGGQQPVDDDITLVVVQYTGASDSKGVAA